MTEISRKIVNHSMDVHGGHAIQVGPRNYVAHAHLANPVSITVEGANILTRNLIIFGQGAIRCHPYILREVELLSFHDEESVNEIDSLLLSHMGYVITNIVRNLWCGLTGGHALLAPVRGPTARYYRQLSRMSAALALLSDTCMIALGGELKRKERLSARLGDMLSELYLASTVLKYFQDHGQPSSDLGYVEWCIETCLYRTQQACDDLLNNFSNRGLAFILRCLIFPWGRAYKKPKDSVSHAMMNAMLTPSDFRDRLTQYCYLHHQEDDAVKQTEAAFVMKFNVDPILKKLQNAIRNGIVSKTGHIEERISTALDAGVLTQSEAIALREFEMLRKEVLKVSEFSFDLKSVLN
jgi:hypothetical protein